VSVPYDIKADGTSGVIGLSDPKDGSHHTIGLSRDPNSGRLTIKSISTGLSWPLPSSVSLKTALSMASESQKQDLQRLVQLVHDAESTITDIINKHNNVSAKPKVAEQDRAKPKPVAVAAKTEKPAPKNTEPAVPPTGHKEQVASRSAALRKEAEPAAPPPNPPTTPQPSKANAEQKPAPANAGPQPDKSSARHEYPDEVVRFGKRNKFALNLKRDKDGKPVMKNGEWVVSTDRRTTVRELAKGPKRDAALKALRQKIHRAKNAHNATAVKNYQHILDVLKDLPHALAAQASPAGNAPQTAYRPPYADINAASEPPRIFGFSQQLPPERGDSTQRAALRLHREAGGKQSPSAKTKPEQAPKQIQAFGATFTGG
jgi:hypothetical protein